MQLPKLFIVLLVAGIFTTGCGKFFKPKTDDWDAETFYNAAKEELDDKKWSKAIELYQQLEARYPYGEYAEQSQLEIAYAYHRHDDREQALAAADRFIRLHPTHPNVDYAYYLKGLINFAENKAFVDKLLGGKDFSDRDPRSALESYQAFDQLITRFPDSRYYFDSVVRMGQLNDALARHDLYVADYYMRRGAYVAVVNRCKYLLENHQRTGVIEQALGLMMIAYKRMDMDELSADTQRILALNYPDSLYLTNPKKALANVKK